jgi:hypothetical protein
MKIRMLVAGALLAGFVPALALAGSRAMHPELGAKLVGNARRKAPRPGTESST